MGNVVEFPGVRGAAVGFVKVLVPPGFLEMRIIVSRSRDTMSTPFSLAFLSYRSLRLSIHRSFFNTTSIATASPSPPPQMGDYYLIHLLSKTDKNLEIGCKNEGLMQYKCMEKEIRMFHGRILFPSGMYIANIPAGMQMAEGTP